MDNSSNQKEVEEYLRGVGLTVPEAVVRQVVKVVSEEVKSSFHKLYAGNKRKGVLPLCGKGTVTKIRNLCQEGRLQRYLDYLGAKPGGGATTFFAIRGSWNTGYSAGWTTERRTG